MTPTVEKTSLDELLLADTPEGYCGTLSTMYEAWISSDHSSGTSADQRGRVLINFKALRRYLFRISTERIKKKTKTKNKHLEWLD